MSSNQENKINSINTDPSQTADAFKFKSKKHVVSHNNDAMIQNKFV